MRLNKFLAQATGMGRRSADQAITKGRVFVNGQVASLGQEAIPSDRVTLDGQQVMLAAQPPTTILLNKPMGYVVSRNGQGSKTVYELLPTEYRQLKPVGRLDKDSSGLLLLTNDGQLAYEFTHPSRQKNKVYEITLDKTLVPLHHQMIADHGVLLDDGPSKFQLKRLHDDDSGLSWEVTMHEGRNRQIRRTFAALGYELTQLHRIEFGPYKLNDLPSGKYTTVTNSLPVKTI